MSSINKSFPFASAWMDASVTFCFRAAFHNISPMLLKLSISIYSYDKDSVSDIKQKDGKVFQPALGSLELQQ